jgi:hypothetical protein
MNKKFQFLRSAIAWLRVARTSLKARKPAESALRSHRRAMPRRALKFKAVLCTTNRQIRVRGLNFHEGGAMVLVDRPLPVKSEVFIYLRSLGTMGFATVRHCSPKRLWGYALGLEFRGKLLHEELGSWQIKHVSVHSGVWAPGEGDSYGWASTERSSE